MSSAVGISLYHLPTVTHFEVALAARYSVLHLVSDDSFQRIPDLQSRFEAEQPHFLSEFTLTHVFVGANPIPASQWLAAEKTSAKVYWYGPEDNDCPVISNKSVSEFPYYLIYEREVLVQAGNTFPSSFSAVITELEERKLRGLAEAATSLRGSDISSQVIISLLLTDLIANLPLPQLIPPPPTRPSPIPLLTAETEQVLSDQQAQIELLKRQVAIREKEVEELRFFAATNPAYIAEQAHRKQDAQIAIAKTSIPFLPPEAGDFWNEEQDEDLAAYPNSQLQDISAVKGLWILSAENEIRQGPQQFRSSQAFSTSSKQSFLEPLPSVRSPKPVFGGQSPVPTSKASSFLEQRQRHLEKLMEKQPIGRDGKRLPIPRLSRSDHKSTPSLKKVPSYRKNALAASELQTPFAGRNRLPYGGSK